MRFSAAILQIAPREPARVRSLTVTTTTGPIERSPIEPKRPERDAMQDPPPDLDQRVRLSGEW